MWRAVIVMSIVLICSTVAEHKSSIEIYEKWNLDGDIVGSTKSIFQLENGSFVSHSYVVSPPEGFVFEGPWKVVGSIGFAKSPYLCDIPPSRRWIRDIRASNSTQCHDLNALDQTITMLNPAIADEEVFVEQEHRNNTESVTEGTKTLLSSKALRENASRVVRQLFFPKLFKVSGPSIFPESISNLFNAFAFKGIGIFFLKSLVNIRAFGFGFKLPITTNFPKYDSIVSLPRIGTGFAVSFPLDLKCSVSASFPLHTILYGFFLFGNAIGIISDEQADQVRRVKASTSVRRVGVTYALRYNPLKGFRTSFGPWLYYLPAREILDRIIPVILMLPTLLIAAVGIVTGLWSPVHRSNRHESSVSASINDMLNSELSIRSSNSAVERSSARISPSNGPSGIDVEHAPPFSFEDSDILSRIAHASLTKARSLIDDDPNSAEMATHRQSDNEGRNKNFSKLRQTKDIFGPLFESRIAESESSTEMRPLVGQPEMRPLVCQPEIQESQQDCDSLMNQNQGILMRNHGKFSSHVGTDCGVVHSKVKHFYSPKIVIRNLLMHILRRCDLRIWHDLVVGWAASKITTVPVNLGFYQSEGRVSLGSAAVLEMQPFYPLLPLMITANQRIAQFFDSSFASIYHGGSKGSCTNQTRHYYVLPVGQRLLEGLLKVEEFESRKILH